MTQQALDLRRSVQLVRRRRLLVGFMVLIGMAIGCAYSVLKPPLLNATALVVFPQTTQSAAAAAAAAAGNGATDTFTSTLEVIASSNQVLAAALPDVRPAVSLEALRSMVDIGSVTSNIISVGAKGKTASDAEATANALASSYIKYVDAPTSPIGNQSASLLQPATTASGTPRVEALIVTGFLGGLAGLLIGVIVAVAVSRRDRRLRARDEIANSIGLPVLASLPAARPSDAGGWVRLMQEYQPEAVHAWQLRRALRRVGMQEHLFGDSSVSLAVLSLASDPGALALGPQLAVFASSLGVPTALVIGPQQDENAVAALRTACAVPLKASPSGRDQPQVAVCEADEFARLPSVALTVVVAVVDGQAPQMPDTVRTTGTVLGVSAGAATAEQLARTAVSAAIDGRELLGIFVANPDPADQTTGQVPLLARPARHRMPTRMNGITTEIRR